MRRSSAPTPSGSMASSSGWASSTASKCRRRRAFHDRIPRARQRMTTSTRNSTIESGVTRQHVRVTSNGTIAELAIGNGPLNLMIQPMLSEMNDALIELAARTDVRCLIVHGGDARAFCAGSDIREFAGLRTNASELKILPED